MRRLETIADFEEWARRVGVERVTLQARGSSGVIATLYARSGVEVRAAGRSLGEALANLALSTDTKRFVTSHSGA